MSILIRLEKIASVFSSPVFFALHLHTTLYLFGLSCFCFAGNDDCCLQINVCNVISNAIHVEMKITITDWFFMCIHVEMKITITDWFFMCFL